MTPEHAALLAGRITDEELSVIRPLYAETYPVRPLLNELDALRSEVVALRKDAERYRWLRDTATIGEAEDALDGCAASMDETIDAALADKPRFTDGRGNSLDHLVDSPSQV